MWWERAYLDQTGVDEDARTERVEHAADDAGGCAARVVCRAYPEADSNS